MRTLDITEKVVPAFEARRQFGKLLKAVEASGDKFVVQKNGEDVAVIVPMRVYAQWRQSRDAFFAQMDVAATNAHLSPEDADRVANEAVKAARAASWT